MHTLGGTRAAGLSAIGVLTALYGGACTGSIDGAFTPDEPESSPRAESPRPGPARPGAPAAPSSQAPMPSMRAPVPSACAPGAAPAPWRRLSNFEYEQTVRDLFGGFELAGAAAHLPPDTVHHVFDNEAAAQGMSVALLEGYLKAAESITATVAADPARLMGCAAGVEDPCFEAFLDRVGPRLFRRALTPGERERVLATYRLNKMDGGFRFGVEAALQRMLVAPQFLYRMDAAGPDGTTLDGFSVASRLSYMLWAAPPDAELMAAAAAGKLRDRAEVARQAERLLGDRRAWTSLGHLFDQLYNLSVVPKQAKDKGLFPRFSDAVARAMHDETVAFLRHLAAGEAPLEDLLTAPYSFLNKELAAYYGVAAAPAGAAFEKVGLDPARSAGLLSQGSFATQTSREKTTWPIDRGKFVRTRLMCDHLPEPPDDIPEAPAFTGKETMRELLARHARDPSCNACHRLIDPLGLGLENLDPAGRWRDSDVGGQPVDASGEVVGGDAPGPFSGPAELGRRLAGSPRARACLTEQLFTYAMARAPSEAERCALAAVDEARRAAGGGLPALVRALVTSDLFLLQRR